MQSASAATIKNRKLHGKRIKRDPTRAPRVDLCRSLRISVVATATAPLSSTALLVLAALPAVAAIKCYNNIDLLVFNAMNWTEKV